MPLLKDYSLSNTSGLNFKIVFQIPDNAEFIVTKTGTMNLITIKLMKGQVEPSLVYKPCLLGLTAESTFTLDLEFEQILSGTSLKRPKLQVVSC